MTAGSSAEDAVFVLQANEVHAVDIQEVGGASVGVNILLNQFKANPGRVGVAGLDVVDGQGNIGRALIFGGDAALARQLVADESNAVDG